MNRIARTLIASAVAVGATVALAAPAHAAPTLDSAKQAVSVRIDKRLDAIKQYETTLGSAGQVTAAHKSTLTKLLGDQRDGLTALKTKLQGETTAAGVKADAQSMVYDYRVFILTGPKVRLTAAIDTELAAITKMRAEPGADAAKLDAIQKSLDGKADALLGVEPGPDGDAIKAAVTPVRQAAKTAHTDLKALHRTK
jgi:hypothetical protein